MRRQREDNGIQGLAQKLVPGGTIHLVAPLTLFDPIAPVSTGFA